MFFPLHIYLEEKKPYNFPIAQLFTRFSSRDIFSAGIS